MKGFTLIELIVVIALMALMSVVAAPTVTSYLARASLVGGEETASHVQAALDTRRDRQQPESVSHVPASLDRLANNTVCSTVTPCFADVALPVTSPQWKKIAADRYEYRLSSLKQVWGYDAGKGTFTCVAGDC